MARISRRKKIIRVLRRKLLKPVLYATGLSLVLYLCISNVVLQKKVVEEQTPRFVITRISDVFDGTEFMHLLLTVQEINKLPKASAQLAEFVNGPFPGVCPPYLEKQLNRMNWAPQAFLSRMHRLFQIYDVYDRIRRLDETIAFLSDEINHERLPVALQGQVTVLQTERNNIVGKDISEDEYAFIKEYWGLVQRLKK